MESIDGDVTYMYNPADKESETMCEDTKVNLFDDTKKSSSSMTDQSHLTVSWQSGGESEEEESGEEEESEEETDDSEEESGSEEGETEDETIEVAGSGVEESGEEEESEEETDDSEECSCDSEESTEGEDESGEEDSEESGKSEEESGSGSEESGKDDEEEETGDEETDEESDAENQTVEERMARSVIKNKSIRFNGDCTAPMSSVKKSALKSSVKKSAIKKTPGIANMSTNQSVYLNKISQFRANESLANIRKSILQTEMAHERLVEKLEALMVENAQIKRDKTKAEVDLRSQLVAKWSKREEDTEEYYQGQRKQVEDCYLKRTDMLELLLNRKAEERPEELRLKKETELEKLRQQVVNQKLELKKAGDEVMTLNRRVDELMQKLKLSEQDAVESFGKLNSIELLSPTTFTIAQPQCVFNEKDTAHISMINEERMSQKCFEASLKLEADETTQQDETSCVDQTTQYETECEETVEGSEDEDMEMETDEDSSLEEVETGYETLKVDETVDEIVNETVDETNIEIKKPVINKSIVKPSLKDSQCQTIEVASRSVEVEANLSSEELSKLKEKLTLKAQECELINEKFLEKVKLIEKLNADINNFQAEHSQVVDELETKVVGLTTELVKVRKELAEKANELKEMETVLADHCQCLENKNVEFEKLQNDIHYHMNQVEKMEFQLEQAKKPALVKTDIPEIQIDENMDVSIETLERIRDLDRKGAEEAAAASENVKRKPPKSNSKSSLKSESSRTSLKRSTRSGSNLMNSSSLNTTKEKDDKSDKKTKKTSLSKPRKSKSENPDESSEAATTKTIKKKASTDGSMRSCKKVSVDPTSDGIVDLVNLVKPMKSTLTKKKSTQNRLTDLITKSPILEPLRNRPKRGGTTLSKDFNCSVMSNMSLNKDVSVLAEKGNVNEKLEKEKAEVTKPKKTTKKMSKLNLMDELGKTEMDVEDTENQVPVAKIASATRKSTRKKKTTA